MNVAADAKQKQVQSLEQAAEMSVLPGMRLGAALAVSMARLVIPALRPTTIHGVCNAGVAFTHSAGK